MTGGRVDLNHAGVRELQTLPGVGKVTAERIVEERERGGPFDSVADLARVGGLGPARIRAIADRART
jgi:competence protein ComEA